MSDKPREPSLIQEQNKTVFDFTLTGEISNLTQKYLEAALGLITNYMQQSVSNPNLNPDQAAANVLDALTSLLGSHNFPSADTPQSSSDTY